MDELSSSTILTKKEKKILKAPKAKAKDSGSKLPVDKHASLEDDSMDEGTPESLKIATPVPSKVSDENAPEEISSASEGIAQVAPVVSQDLEPQTGKGLKNKKVPSKQLDSKSKEADVA